MAVVSPRRQSNPLKTAHVAVLKTIHAPPARGKRLERKTSFTIEIQEVSVHDLLLSYDPY